MGRSATEKNALVGCIPHNESSVHGLESFKIQINMFRFLSIKPFLSFIAKRYTENKTYWTQNKLQFEISVICEGESNENLKSAIKIPDTARLLVS